MGEQYFDAKWDGLLKGISLFGSTLLVGVPLLAAVLSADKIHLDGPWGPVILFLLVTVGPGITALTFAWAPKGYRVTSNALVIVRWVGEMVIPIRTVSSVERIERDTLKGSLRMWGSGGLFGYYGRFWSRKMGHYRMYATQVNGFVLVEADRKYVLTPDRVMHFVAAAKMAAGLDDR